MGCNIVYIYPYIIGWQNAQKNKNVNKFYKSTKYFWILSRIVLIILFSVAILNRISETHISDLIVSALFLIIFFLMITITIIGLLKKNPHYLLRFVVGAFFVLFGFLSSYLLTLGKTDYAIHIKIGFQLVPLWIILYGIYEITNGINTLKLNRY